MIKSLLGSFATIVLVFGIQSPYRQDTIALYPAIISVSVEVNAQAPLDIYRVLPDD
jgi:hypothetical protein